MKNVFKWIGTIQRNMLFYVLSFIQLIFIIIYINASKGLEKPAGFIEAITFLFKSPQHYFVSMLLGVLCWVIVTILILSTVIEIPMLMDGGNSYYDESEEINRTKYIINIIITIGLLIGNFIFLKFLFLLLFTVIVITLIVGFLLNQS